VTALLKVTVQTIVNMEMEGLIRPVKLTGKRLVRYKMEDIERLIDNKDCPA